MRNAHLSRSFTVAVDCQPWRVLLASLLAILACWGGDAAPAGTLRLEGAGFALVGTEGGDLAIVDAAARPVLTLSGFDLKGGQVRTVGGRASRAAGGAIRIDYELQAGKAESPGAATAYALATCAGNRVTVAYHLSPAAGLDLANAMVLRRAARPNQAAPVVKMGRWVRHAGGGVPFEERDGVFRRFAGDGIAVWEVIRGNPGWADDSAQHQPWTPPGQAGEVVAVVEYLVHPATAEAAQVAAAFHGRPLAINLATGQPFNLWDAGATPALTVTVANASVARISAVRLGLTLRDFDGRMLPGFEQSVDLEPGETRRIRHELPGFGPGICFVEAAASGGGGECFARTTLGVIEPFAFPDREHGILGLAAAFPVPSAEAVADLSRRIGVRWLRNGDSREAAARFGGIANRHSSELHADAKDWAAMAPGQRDEALRALLQEADRLQNPWWELGNEWDLTKGEGRATAYVEEWLKPIARLRAAGGFQVKMLSQGFANGFHGLENLRLLREAGGWELIDGIAYHLGRGNLTPDATSGNVWNFLGSLRELKARVAEYGAKPIFITEAYATTPPNTTWNDAQRRAPENIVLTCALAMSEGVAGLFFYQLHDAVWFDVGGIDPADAEYHYGLLARDGAVKPSLLAFQAIARALDGARFERWLELPAPSMRGLAFATPRGPMAVLWDRSDGFVQVPDKAGYVAPEPWVDHWRTRTTARLRAVGGSVTVTDCIGRTRSLAAPGGRIDLELTGAPLIVHGLAWGGE